MRERLNSLEIEVAVKEISQLSGYRINRILHENDNVYLFLSKEGDKRILRIIVGKAIFISKYEPKLEEITGFCMNLRKWLMGCRLQGAEQYDLERVVKIEFLSREKKNIYLIVELIPRGNLVLCDENFKILSCLKVQEFKDRVIKRGIAYSLPPSRASLPKSFEDFLGRLKKDGEIVKELANNFPLGIFAEEILARVGIDKKRKVIELSGEEMKKIYELFNEIIEEVRNLRINPNVILSGNEVVDFSIFDMEFYKGFEKKFFKTFSEVLDYYYLSIEEKIERSILSSEFQRLKDLLSEQEKMRKEIFENSKRLREIGSKILENLELLDDFMKNLKELRNKYSIKEINERIKASKEKIYELKFVKEVDIDGVTFEVNGTEFKVYFDESIGEVANRFFEEAKKFEKKLDGVEKAIEETKRKINELKLKKIEPKVKEIKFRKKDWYEKFRWFLSSEGFLVIAGRDAVQNEILFKKYLEKEDLVLHTDIQGSPLTIIKRGRKASEITLKEAAIFTASYSRAWKYNLIPKVYWLNAEQISKTPQSGQFLPKGSFIIRGRKNYINCVELRIAISYEKVNDSFRVIYGPESSIKWKNKKYLVVIPGNERKEVIAKKILNFLGVELDINEIIAALPGNGAILENEGKVR